MGFSMQLDLPQVAIACLVGSCMMALSSGLKCPSIFALEEQDGRHSTMERP